MVKLSITLPNNTMITLECEETGLVHEVLGLVMRDTNPDARSVDLGTAVYAGEDDAGMEKSTSAPDTHDVQTPATGQRRANDVAPPQASEIVSHAPNGIASNGDSAVPAGTFAELGDDILDLGRYSQQAQDDFTAFCQAINPTGDMRRVVVAAEGANRFFGLEGITADELGDLFDLIGWRRANSFTQTIRNAARAKFRWLERIPGRSGRYAATDLGRATTLSG